jgi:hypothetical protein
MHQNRRLQALDGSLHGFSQILPERQICADERDSRHRLSQPMRNLCARRVKNQRLLGARPQRVTGILDGQCGHRIID